MICPVCQQAHIPSLATTCPSCKASLLGIKLLDALEEKYVDTAKANVALEGEQVQKKIAYERALKKKNRQVRGLFFLVCLLPFLYYLMKPDKPKVVHAPVIITMDTLDWYKKTLTEKELALDKLKQQLLSIQSTQEIREIEYIVKKGDRLYDLGILFYNDTSAWYQLALDNKIYDVRGLPIGDTLRIKYRD